MPSPAPMLSSAYAATRKSAPSGGGDAPSDPMNTAAYYADIRDCLPRRAALVKTLPPGRMGRMMAYRDDGDRLRCLAAWVLLARLLGRDGRLPESRISLSPYGKPALDHGPCFNLSHSGDFVLLAVCESDVGADLERWEAEDHDAMARAGFHADELGRAGGDVSPKAFYARWTAKESFLKMEGVGLGRNPAAIILRMHGDGALVEGRPDARIRVYDDLEGYTAAVCACAPLPDRLVRVDLG
ncbi:MAG: 4'-phosphopantetheinyl transferase superfamily protein [Desulfovibrio sp.]|nr:4'-phosphopantetheinyl transferase superfamily protein [Desulfovibrio sp.]